jgi:hypothetical protein
MKTLIKTSFILVLIMGFCNFGLNSIRAKNSKTENPVRYGTIMSRQAYVIPVRLSNKLANISWLLDTNYQSSFHLLISQVRLHCRPKTARISKNEVYVVQSNCIVHIYHINPQKG